MHFCEETNYFAFLKSLNTEQENAFSKTRKHKHLQFKKIVELQSIEGNKKR